MHHFKCKNKVVFSFLTFLTPPVYDKGVLNNWFLTSFIIFDKLDNISDQPDSASEASDQPALISKLIGDDATWVYYPLQMVLLQETRSDPFALLF